MLLLMMVADRDEDVQVRVAAGNAALRAAAFRAGVEKSPDRVTSQSPDGKEVIVGTTHWICPKCSGMSSSQGSLCYNGRTKTEAEEVFHPPDRQGERVEGDGVSLVVPRVAGGT